MKVRWAGSYDPHFSRNQQLRRMFDRCKVELVERPRASLPADRQALVGARKLEVAVRMFFHAIGMMFGELVAEAPDVYFCSYPGAFDVPVLRLVSRLKRRPLVFDAFISMYDTAVSDRRLISDRTLVASALRLVDRWAVRLSDVVIVDTPEHARFFAGISGNSLSKFVVVRVGADEDVFRPNPSAVEVHRLVTFYGSYVPLQSVATIVDAAARLESDGVTFRLIGDGQDRSDIEQKIESLKLRNVTLVDSVPLGMLNEEIQRAQVVLGIFGAGDKAQRVVPHKVYEACAAGRPLVTADSPAIRSAFHEGELLTVPPEDGDALAAAILHLLENDDVRKVLAEGGRSRFMASFKLEELAAHLQVALSRSVL